MSSKTLSGKNAIVTGASRGIGRGIAFELANRGANILLTYNSSQSQADAIATQIHSLGVDAIAVKASANDPDAPVAIIQAAIHRWGNNSVDIIVNNAATREDVSIENISPEIWQRQLMANLQFPVFLIREAVQYFGTAPRIVNMSTNYARDGPAGCLAYVAAKGAMESVTRSLARELGHKYGATVNCVAPGPVNTELWGQSLEIMDEGERASWEYVIQNTPAAARVADVDDIVQIVCFLCEERSRWVTGSVVNANGGFRFD